MKAVYIEAHGGPEALEFGDLPDPAPGDGEIVVDIRAASVNGADWKMRAGKYGPLSDFPHILGRDFSGVVAALGAGVAEFDPGDPVFGVCPAGSEGAYAEKIAIDPAIVARKPDSISHAEISALSLIGLTALVSIEDTIRLRPGETVLIHGGAGGVAGFAVQLAKHIGARVVATASTENHDYVRALGAEIVIDYNAVDVASAAPECDAVLDTVGGEAVRMSFAVLKPGGRAAFIASGPAAPPSPRSDVVSLRPRVGRDRAHLERILRLFEDGAVRAPEIRRYPLALAGEAHRISEGRHLRGKLVLETG